MVQTVKKFLDDHQMAHKVRFRGKHCFGHCENGPSMMVGEKRYEHITPDSIVEILENELL